MSRTLVCVALLLAVLCVTATAYSYERRAEAEEGDELIDEMNGMEGEMRGPHERVDTMMRPPVHPMMKNPYHAPMIRRRLPLTTHNLTTLFMRALDTKNVLVLMMMVDARTLIAYDSEVPAGGLYKGRRGLLEMGESCLKSMRITNSSYKILNVDEDRNTASVVRSFTGVARRTGTTVTARTMFVFKFALGHVACLDIVDLDYDVLKAALSTKAEKALEHLAETWFEYGVQSPRVWDLLADNVSVVFGAVEPKKLFSANGKQNIINHLRTQHKSDSCKMLECLSNHTDYTTVLHADDSRVVSVNYAGNMLGSRKLIDRFSEGTILHGVTRIDSHLHKNEVVVYFTLHEFDSDGKLTRVFIQLTRPLTMLDRIHMRNVHNITIMAGGD